MSVSPLPSPPNRPTVLVAEDAEAVRMITARVLTEAGYQVVTAADGVEALQLIDQSAGAIRVVVIDLVMPRMGGRELAAHLANRIPSVKFVFLTGYPDLSLRHDLPGHVFLKPYPPDQLIARVGALLREQAGETVGEEDLTNRPG
jgi:CheY-like chemotaxis protein